MARQRTRFSLLLAVAPLLALSLGACSFNLQAGTKPGDKTGKPAQRGESDAPATGGKSVATADDQDDAVPGADPKPVADPKPGADPEPAADPPSGVRPRGPTGVTAVCRVRDASLEDLCHLALDPIAANDIDAWVDVLGEGVVLTRPSRERGSQRFTGPSDVRKIVMKSGGLRPFVHVEGEDRVVGTVSTDCRNCRRSYVAFQANTRTGTMVVSLDLGQPPTVFSVELGSDLRRRKIGTVRPPKKDEPSTTIQPPADKPATGGTTLAPNKTEVAPAKKDPS